MKSSRFIGVTRHQKDKKWQAAIKVGGRSIHLGHFETEVAAAKAYDKEARVLGRKVNFKETFKQIAEEYELERFKILELLKMYD
jgi:thiamine monophosphate synthase